jgi:D-alanyl-D-alanine carboxypeptidase
MRKILAVLLLLSTASMSAATLPATPAAKVFEAWLTAYNSGDPRQLEAYKETYHRHWAVRDILDDRMRTGGYTVLRVEKSEPLELTVLVQEKDSDAVHREDVVVGAGDPPTSVAMSIQHDVQRSADLTVPRLTQAQVIDALAGRATALEARDKFSGAILVARQESILLQRGWGKANRSSGKANTADTQFRIGSMNKMFTSIAVLQLVQAGKVSLDAPFGQYLADYPNKSAASHVTIRELLNHTGGTGDIFGADFDTHRDKLRSNDDYVKLYGSRELDHAPGGKFEYSNYGFVLLGAVIEKASGMSYYDYVERHIFKPAGMSSTGSLPESDVLPRRANGYMRQGDTWSANDSTLPLRGTAAGGGYSTIGDIFRFAQALQAGKLVSKATLSAATQPVFHDASSGYGYGYGFEVLSEGGLKSYGHEGAAPGMNGELRVFPDQGYVIVILSNLDPPAAHRLVEYFSLRMPRPN